MTTKNDIREWLNQSSDCNTHMLVVCDTFDYADYPVYVNSKEEAIRQKDSAGSMQSVMEVYDLSLDFEEQLNAERVFNF